MERRNAEYRERARIWSEAVQRFRQSLDVYRDVLRSRTQRYPRHEAVQNGSIVPERPSDSDERLMLLTPREREVSALIARGYTNQQIAETLVVTRGTVANHVAHILNKLNLANRTQVAAYLVGRLDSGPTSNEVPDPWVEDPIRKVS